MIEKQLKSRLKSLFADVAIPEPTPTLSQTKPGSQKTATKPPQLESVTDIAAAPTKFKTTALSDLAQKIESKPIRAASVEPSFAPASPTGRRRSGLTWQSGVWLVLITLVTILLLVTFGRFGLSVWFSPPAANNQSGFAAPLVSTPTATASLTPSATPTAQLSRFVLVEPTVTPTPVPGGRVLVLTPAAEDVGWVSSEGTAGAPSNHFGDSFLYAGRWSGKTYHAAFQFNLGDIPRGTKIHAASLRLTGLRADQLAEGGSGRWRLQLLASEIDDHWRSHNYQQIHNAAPRSTFEPGLTSAQLGADWVNDFEFSPQQLTLLERHLLESSPDSGPTISFRLDGPLTGSDDLFAWDSGFGPDSQGNGPELFLNLGPPPPETPPPYYVIITSTPTPETVLTAAAISLRLTAEATRIGTATPLPPNWVTPIVVTATPVPENQATAEALSRAATAIALTTGEPPNVATATATPTYVIITSTPTPQDIMTAVAEGLRTGLVTPLPSNWVTPLVVTSTPTPANSATVEYRRAVMLTTGTPTPMPANVQTATSTPVAMAAPLLALPTATATPTPTPQPIPAELLGKIIFLSDREGASAEERLRADQAGTVPQVELQPYVFDPATGQLERLSARWPYDVALAREGWSADEVFETYTKKLQWTNVNGTPTEVFAIHYYDYVYNTEQVVTRMGAGIAYDPVWSPVSDEIAFVATESGNDEIWLIKRDGTEARQLTRNEWEWDKHPSWSPDGQQIVFFSNRTGNNQLWIMNKDGGEQRLLMDWTPYNDSNPIWIKYLEPAPPAARQPDWRFIKPPDEK